MNTRHYLLVSGLVFALVAIAHLVRVIQQWPILVDQWSVPMQVSWLAIAIPAALSLWAFSLAGRTGTGPR